MAALDFPDNPTVGQVFEKWTWNGNAWVLTGGSGAGGSPIKNDTSTAYSPLPSDANYFITLSNTSPITVTMPSDATQPFAVAAEMRFMQLSSGQVTFVAGPGAVVLGSPSVAIRARYSSVLAKKIIANTWIIFGDSDSIIPIGTMWQFGGAVLPPNWLWCDGATYVGTAKPALFAAIARTHTAAGVAAGSFQVPDMRTKVAAGAHPSDAAFLLGKFAGQRDSELFSHLHVVPIHGHTATGTGSSGTVSADHTHLANFMSQPMDRSIDHLHHMQHTHPPSGGNTNSGWMYRGPGQGGWDPGGTNANGWGGYYSNGAGTYYADRDYTGAADRSLDHLHHVYGNTGGISTNHTHSVSVGVTVNNAAAFNTVATGGGTTLTDKNLSPYVAVNYMIYAGG